MGEGDLTVREDKGDTSALVLAGPDQLRSVS